MFFLLLLLFYFFMQTLFNVPVDVCLIDSLKIHCIHVLFQVLVAFVWRDRLRGYCELHQQYFSVPVLTLHWHWFLEKSLVRIPQQLGQVQER